MDGEAPLRRGGIVLVPARLSKPSNESFYVDVAAQPKSLGYCDYVTYSLKRQLDNYIDGGNNYYSGVLNPQSLIL